MDYRSSPSTTPRRRWHANLFRSIARLWRRLHQAVSRSEWSLRLLRLPCVEGESDQPGLVLVQVDGLSRTQFDEALRRGRMPFLRRLLRRKGYRLRTMYSGQPATTPAVQGELFYGVKCAVPSFRFCEHETGAAVKMFSPRGAAKVEGRLRRQGVALLAGGSAYADIYAGGAEEAHFCPAATGWGGLLDAVRWWRAAIFLLLYAATVLRVAAMMFVEFFVALADFCRGLRAGHNLWGEMVFVSARVGVGILMRELLVIGAGIDAARGLPVIHVNFLGYDEQSHRRGPGAKYPHWSLHGIDHAIRRVWRAARRATRRNYQVWIYSDHGQEATVPYRVRTGRSIETAIAAVFQMPAVARGPQETMAGGIEHQRVAWLGGDPMQEFLRRGVSAAAQDPCDVPEERRAAAVEVTAMGPLGHVYAPTRLDARQRDEIARRLVDEAQIPLVLMVDGDRGAAAWTPAGRFRLPDEAAAVLGFDHPFLDEVARDLTAVCHHADAGAWVISGWSPHAPPLSFIEEQGGHGGPGREETRAFLLLPGDVRLPDREHDYLRPLDLRRAVLEHLGRTDSVSPGGATCPEAA